MGNASPPPSGAPAGPAGAPGDQRQSADPLAEIVKHCTDTWQALRTHVALLIDDGIGRFYGFLLTAALVLIALTITMLMMMLGCYYLVSGIALGMTQLVGSAWIGKSCTGAIFLLGPALIGFIAAASRRHARERRIVSTYRSLQDQAAAP